MANDRRRQASRRRPEKRTTDSQNRKRQIKSQKQHRTKNVSRPRSQRRDEIPRRRKGRRAKKGFASWSAGKKVLAVLLGVFILLITAAIAVLAGKWGKVGGIKLDIGKLNISEEAEELSTGYLNVALFGLDTRTNSDEMGERSDTIIIASLNRATKEVKLASVYRDTLLKMPDDSNDPNTYDKANAAYSYGTLDENGNVIKGSGPQAAVAMLNENLDLDIQYYVTVNFNVMVDVIDALGGIDIYVDTTEDYISVLNGYCMEIIENTGKDSMGFEQVGTVQHLNGTQATAYARLRYGEGGDGTDFKRAERQRAVLEQMAIKAQSAKLSTLNKIIDKVFDNLETNFSLTEVIAYAKDVKKYKLGETTGFPAENTTPTLDDVGSVVLATDYEASVRQLHEFLFPGEVYTPSATVQAIAQEIAAYNSAGYNTGGYDSSYDQGYGSYDSGYDSGYNTGYDPSYDNGYDSGYGDGSSGGYDQNYPNYSGGSGGSTDSSGGGDAGGSGIGGTEGSGETGDGSGGSVPDSGY